MNAVISRATPDQAGRILQIMKRATEDCCSSHYPPEIIAIWHKGRSVEDMAKTIASQFVFSAHDREKLCGFIQLHESRIVGLFVDPELQGKGYGTALFRFAEEAISTRPIRFRSTLNAVTFYEKLGCIKLALNTLRRHDRDIYFQEMAFN